MTTHTKSNIQLVSGKLIPAGSLCQIIPLNDTWAIINTEGMSFRMKHRDLHVYFPEFIPVTDEEMHKAFLIGKCPSVTGYNVEPDGHDPEGFPSILLAAGFM